MKKYLVYLGCSLMQIPVLFTELFYLGLFSIGVISGICIASIIDDIN